MDQKSEHLKLWAKNKNKNLMGIAQKILLGMTIKSKNMAKIFLGGGQMTKIKTKLYIFFISIFFFPYLGGTMAHPGSPLAPSVIATCEKNLIFQSCNLFHTLS
jgi:hypothetical protein